MFSQKAYVTITWPGKDSGIFKGSDKDMGSQNTVRELSGAPKAQRNSNIELLRIVAMLMIAAYHYSIYSFYAEDLYSSCGKYFIDLIGNYGKTGVNLFVMISGYYLAKQEFSVKRLLKIAGQLWFYSLFALAIAVFVFGYSADMGILRRSIFPITGGYYWFASYYVMLLLLSPLLNRFAAGIGNDKLRLSILLLLLLYSILPTFFRVYIFFTEQGWFVTLYLTAAYLRLYGGADPAAKKSGIWRALVWGACIPAFAWVCTFAGSRTGGVSLMELSGRLGTDSSFFGYMFALGLLRYFLSREPVCIPAVNTLASATFGVYLFHENIFARDVLGIWSVMLDPAQYINSSLLPLQALGTIVIVYLVGTAVDLLRQATAGRLWDKAVDKLSPNLEQFGRKALSLLTSAAGKRGF